MEHVAATRCADLRKNILFSLKWCGFLEIGWKKREKKSKIMSVTERPIDRSIGRPVDFFCLFFRFFPSRVLLLEYSYFDPRNYFISRHTFDREREKGREKRREKREKMAASVSWSQRWLRPEVRKIVLF